MGLSEFVNVPGGGRFNASDVRRESVLTCDRCGHHPPDGGAWREVDLVVKPATPYGFAQGTKTTYYFCSSACQNEAIHVSLGPSPE
jgi:hypothetical protein